MMRVLDSEILDGFAPLISIVDDDDALRQSLDDLIRAIGFRARLCLGGGF